MQSRKAKRLWMFAVILILTLVLVHPLHPPQVSAAAELTIDSHSDGQQVPVGKVRISGSFTHVHDIQLVINGSKLISARMENADQGTGTWYYDLDTSRYDGEIDITAKGIDADTRGGVLSDPIRLVVDNPPVNIPTVNITDPADGSKVKKKVKVNVSVNAKNPIKEVQVRVNGGAWHAAARKNSQYVYEWESSGIGDKTCSLEAKAVDSRGNVGKSMTTYVKVGAGTKEAITVKSQDRAMWIWENASYNLFLNPGSRTVLDAMAKDTATFDSDPITTLYVGVDKLDGMNILEEDPDKVRDFVSWAHGKGYQVQATIAGGTVIPYWATYPRYHGAAVREMEKVINYNIASAPDERFDGVNVDIEPYILPDFKTKKPHIQTAYLDLLEKMIQRRDTAGYNIPFGPAIPRWYDSSENAADIPWRGEEKWLSEHIQDISDYIAIMDYRDQAERPAGIIAQAQGEIDYAKKIGKPRSVVIGVETKDIADGSDPETITFREEGRTYMERELDKVYTAFGNNPAFAGIAMHHYDSIRDLPSVWGPNMRKWEPPADTTPPSALSSNPVAEASTYERINLRYGRAFDNTEVEEYWIYRSTTPGFTPGPSNLAGTSRGLSYSDHGLLPDTTYYYKVAAVDVKGNRGPVSGETSATTHHTTLKPMIIRDWKIHYDGTKMTVSMKVADRETGQGVPAAVAGRFTYMSGKYIQQPTAADGTWTAASQALPYQAGEAGFEPRRITADGYYWAAAYDPPRIRSATWMKKVPISEDAHVRSGSYADTNYGFSTLLEVKDAPNATGADFDRISYLKGDLGGYPGTSTLSAALYFHVNTDVSDPAVPFVPVTVKGLTDNRWSENTVTWNSRPGSSGETILGTVKVNKAGWYRIDVTDFINRRMADRRVTFRLSDESTQDRLIRINSKDHADDQPYLVIY
ncbi:fibronectin type III domain protein [Desmospora sp. 8437]|nr:fibronectin type III domain protein [Desmospora sp. 8437]